MENRFHVYLKGLRADRQYTQEQMAKYIGVSRSTYANYETGKRTPDYDILLKISDTLQCSLDMLFGRNTETTDSTDREESTGKKGIGIGVQDFRKLREWNSYYVDKSAFIIAFMDSSRMATLITRPRRFGKTLNMSMLAEFLDCTKQSKELFEGTDVSRNHVICECNRHPVVFLSFLNVKGDTEEALMRQIYHVLWKEYQRYEGVFGEESVSKSQRDRIQEIYNCLQQFKMKDVVVTAILELCNILKEYYGKNVYLFIDEYDTPFISANSGGYYDKIRCFLSVMFSSALKGNDALEKALLTGIQRMAKENIFSGLNNLAVYTVKDPEYASYFGFTEEETREILRYYGLELTPEVKRMYDGYQIGGIELYNPWSITYYASRKKLEPYWVNTSENSIIEQAMDRCGQAFQKDYEKLLEKGKVIVQANLESSFFEYRGKDALWGLLINAGMVVPNDLGDGFFEVRIPNQEVSKAFQKLTAHSLQVEHGSLISMIWKLKNGELDDFIWDYKQILLELPSYHDLRDENSYHMMMLGMCAYLYGEYEIKSNRESGQGRSDIILKPLQNQRPAFILEFKYTKDEKKDLTVLAEEALEQIADKKYDTGMKNDVYYIGLAHCGKNVEIAYRMCSDSE